MRIIKSKNVENVVEIKDLTFNDHKIYCYTSCNNLRILTRTGFHFRWASLKMIQQGTVMNGDLSGGLFESFHNAFDAIVNSYDLKAYVFNNNQEFYKFVGGLV